MQADLQEAMLLLKRGDEDALERAVALLQQSVFAFSMRVCGQQQDAEDTMQEVLLKSIPYLPRFGNPKALGVWLYKVAKNQCLMSRRKSKFAPKAELSLEELIPVGKDLEFIEQKTRLGPETSAIRSEQDRQLREAIRKLPPQYRIVIVLRDMEGLNDDEVSEITGLRPGTVRVRLHRARLFVRRELSNGNHHGRNPNLQSHQNEIVSARVGGCKKLFARLSDYLDGKLDDFSCEEIKSHMESCPPCKKVLRSLEATIKRCQHSRADCPNPEKAFRLRKRLLAIYSRALANANQ